MLTDLLNQVTQQRQDEWCQLQGISGYAFTTNGKGYTTATLAQNGHVAKVTIWQGKGPQLTDQHIGHRLCFNLNSKMYKNQIQVQGFWNDKAQIGSENAPQTPQPTNAPKQGVSAQYEKTSIVEAVCNVCAHHENMSLAEVRQWCDSLWEWVTGETPGGFPDDDPDF